MNLNRELHSVISRNNTLLIGIRDPEVRSTIYRISGLPSAIVLLPLSLVVDLFRIITDYGPLKS